MVAVVVVVVIMVVVVVVMVVVVVVVMVVNSRQFGPIKPLTVATECSQGDPKALQHARDGPWSNYWGQR